MATPQPKQIPATLKCIRFQYQADAVNPPAYETMPFYLIKIRSLLKRTYGHTAWFKGNSGGERAAWLVYDNTVTDQVVRLFNEPLDAGGIFKVTAAPGDAREIIERYLIRDKVDIVGGVEVLDFILGNKEPPRIGAKPWWEKYDWKQGFWYRQIKLGGKWLHHHISADYATTHQDGKGLMLRLHNFVETSIGYRGKAPPELCVDQNSPDDDEYVWEKDILSWIEEGDTLEQVKAEEPAWLNFLDAIKIGG